MDFSIMYVCFIIYPNKITYTFLIIDHHLVCRLFAHSPCLSQLTGPVHLTMEKQSTHLLNKKRFVESAFTIELLLMCSFFFYFLLYHGDRWRKVCVWIRAYSSAKLISSLRVIMEQCSLSQLMESLLDGSQRRVHFREFTPQYDMIPKVNSDLHTKLFQCFQCIR